MKLLLLPTLGVFMLAGADGGSTVDALALLREFGFPIFVCLWFMWRLERRIERFTESIEKLYTINMVLAKAVDELDELPRQLPPSTTVPP